MSPRPSPSPFSDTRQRGSAYIAVLGLSLVVATIGMGAMLALRSLRRAADLQNDEGDARAYAQGAVEIAGRTIALTPTWRTAYSNNTPAAARPFGRGTLTFKFVDELDANLSDDAMEPVRVYGVGRVGGAARVVSVVLAPSGPTLDALLTAAYSAGGVTLGGGASASGGPVACAGTCTVPLLNTFNGDVECGNFFGLGAVNGTVNTGVAPRLMPSANLYNTYRAAAIPILYSSILGSSIQKKLISAGSNPYGSASTAGIYVIDVPALSTLTINQSRLAATLVVNLGVGATLTLSGPVTWDPPADNMPTLIVRATGLASVNINGSAAPLSEASAGINFNPPSSPYFGASDANLTGTYASEVHGLIHVIGASVSTTFTAGAVLRGSCISEGSITLSGGATLFADSALYAIPPQGYFTPTGMAVQASTWRREQDN